MAERQVYSADEVLDAYLKGRAFERDVQERATNNVLGLIDKTVDNVVDLDPSLPWENHEVLELLGDVRNAITEPSSSEGRGCPTCSWPHRETVGMVCQTCGTDYAPESSNQQEDSRG